MPTCSGSAPHGASQRATRAITAPRTPGRCGNGRWCRGDHDGHGALLPVELPLCDPCLDSAARDVRALVLDYLDLEQLLGVKVKSIELIIAGTRDPSTPYALGIDALQRAIWHTLTTWEEIIRERARLAEPARQVRQGWAVQHAVAVLHPRINDLVMIGPTSVYPLDATVPEEQTGLDAILTFTALHRRARAALGLTRRIETVFGDCVQCGWTALRRESGSETVYCDNCHDCQTWDDYQRWLRLLYAEARMLKRSDWL